MRAHVYASRVQAQRVIDAIDAARGPTEVVRLPNGTLELAEAVEVGDEERAELDEVRAARGETRTR